MKYFKINQKSILSYLKNLNCDTTGIKILYNKSKINCIYLQDIKTAAANILKQDALSIGADLAVPKGTILHTTKTVDAILIGTNKHLKILSKKELSQPFGLQQFAQELKKFLNNKQYKTKIMGVINSNDDSFYSGSRFIKEDAIKQIKQMIQDGADIIDIGAVSSRPGSKPVDKKEELNRIKDICDTIKKEKLYKKVDFSIDSYTPSVVKYALKSGFAIVNDITGLQNNKIAKLVAKYNATVVIMHMQGKPQTMQQNPTYENVILEVSDFFEQRIAKAKKFGIKKIVLDVGIGFGKTLEHNILLLQNLEHFKSFGYELLIGASRKSMINMIVPTKVEERLPGTLAIHLQSINNGASIIRCHDVKEHYQAISINAII